MSVTNLPGGDRAARTALTEEPPTEVPPGSAPDGVRDEAAASREAADTIMQAFGGVRGMIDMTVPGLVFVIVFTLTHKVPPAAWSALALTAVFVVIRLARRETLQHAFSGVFGVAISAWISMKTGKAEDFYLPGLLWNVGYCFVLALTALFRWPMIGVMLGPITGEMFTWRTENPGRLRAYTKATWAWVVIMGVKPVILFPLYFTHNATLLGWLKTALGIPALVLAMYVTYRILIKAPAPIKAPTEEDEEADKAE